jgi:hypothetical protein
MFDVKSLAIKESTVLHLKNPFTDDFLFVNDKGELDAKGKNPVTVTVASKGSREYRIAVNAMINRSIKRGNKKLNAEEQKAEGIELLVACCLDSENLSYDGEPVKTDAQFRAMLNDDSIGFIKEQIDEALGTIELFK